MIAVRAPLIATVRPSAARQQTLVSLQKLVSLFWILLFCGSSAVLFALLKCSGLHREERLAVLLTNVVNSPLMCSNVSVIQKQADVRSGDCRFNSASRGDK